MSGEHVLRARRAIAKSDAILDAERAIREKHLNVRIPIRVRSVIRVLDHVRVVEEDIMPDEGRE